MRFDILTLFPTLFAPFLEEGVIGRAVQKGLLKVNLVNIRSFAEGPHNITDDRPYGGGSGMVMKADPIYRALESVEREKHNSKVILLTPQGKTFNQEEAWKLADLDQMVIICGRYEGVDERIRNRCVDMEISIGDYILSGGEPAAMVLLDSVSRLVPGVLGCERSNREDSFEDNLLEYPHYTRPRNFMGDEVPEILLSGDHEKIRIWRRKESLKRTRDRRPDILEKAALSDEDKKILANSEE